MEILIHGDLDEDADGEVIIRGTITKEAINSLQTGPYQRSANFSPAKTKRLMEAIKDRKIHQFPDVILGMRGHNWRSTNHGIVLTDPTFIIDGVQRIFAWRIVSDDDVTREYRMGAKVYINTNADSENEMFRALNTGHTAMAPSVILRNEKEHSRVAAMLYGLSHQANFALCRRVCWDQAMNKSTGGDLLRGSILLRMLMALHAHKLPGAKHGTASGTGILATLASMDSQIDCVGLQQSRTNMVACFDAIDEAWGVRSIVQSHLPIQLSWGWLETVAKIFSNHVDFWRADDKQLFVPTNFIRDLKAKVDPDDDELIRLAQGKKTGRELLYDFMVRRINKGKITNRMKQRKADDANDERERAQPGA